MYEKNELIKTISIDKEIEEMKRYVLFLSDNPKEARAFSVKAGIRCKNGTLRKKYK